MFTFCHFFLPMIDIWNKFKHCAEELAYHCMAYLKGCVPFGRLFPILPVKTYQCVYIEMNWCLLLIMSTLAPNETHSWISSKCKPKIQ